MADRLRRLIVGILLTAFLGAGLIARQDGELEDAVPLTTVDPVVSPLIYQSGTVVLRVAVTAGGRVSDIDVVSGFPGLTDPVVSAVTQWRFEPARLDDRPVASRTTVVVHVALQRNVAPPVR